MVWFITIVIIAWSTFFRQKMFYFHDIPKVKNIGFDGYIGAWILRIYRRYISGYFYMNIDISEINKNTLKFMEILCKSVKMTSIIKCTH